MSPNPKWQSPGGWYFELKNAVDADLASLMRERSWPRRFGVLGLVASLATLAAALVLALAAAGILEW